MLPILRRIKMYSNLSEKEKAIAIWDCIKDYFDEDKWYDFRFSNIHEFELDELNIELRDMFSFVEEAKMHKETCEGILKGILVLESEKMSKQANNIVESLHNDLEEAIKIHKKHLGEKK